MPKQLFSKYFWKLFSKPFSNHLLPVLRLFSSSFFLLFKKPRFLALSAAADFLFLFLYGLVAAPLVQKILEAMSGFLSYITAAAAPGAASGAGQAAAPAAASATPSAGSFALLILAYAALVYLLFVVFQGIAWWAAGRLAEKPAGEQTAQKGEKKTTKPTALSAYLFRFSKAQLGWYVLFVLIHGISYVSTLAAIAARQARSLGHATVFVFFFSVLFYFSAITAALLPSASAATAVKKAITIGVGKLHRILLPGAGIMAAFYAVNLLVRLFSFLLPQSMAGRILFVALSGIAVFPFLCFGRAVAVSLIQKLFNQ